MRCSICLHEIDVGLSRSHVLTTRTGSKQRSICSSTSLERRTATCAIITDLGQLVTQSHFFCRLLQPLARVCLRAHHHVVRQSNPCAKLHLLSLVRHQTVLGFEGSNKDRWSLLEMRSVRRLRGRANMALRQVTCSGFIVISWSISLKGEHGRL